MRNEAGRVMHRERLRAGAVIADRLPKYKTLEETATAIGISQTAVRDIECLALWKIQHRLKQLGITSLHLPNER